MGAGQTSCNAQVALPTNLSLNAARPYDQAISPSSVLTYFFQLLPAVPFDRAPASG